MWKSGVLDTALSGHPGIWSRIDLGLSPSLDTYSQGDCRQPSSLQKLYFLHQTMRLIVTTTSWACVEDLMTSILVPSRRALGIVPGKQ